LSPLKNAQDILFTCDIPAKSATTEIAGTKILLENVHDPGNTGTIIRTAEAFGISRVIFSGRCADPYNPKSVRASMGAIFRQDICELSLGDLAMLKDKGERLIGASVSDGCRDIRDISLKGAIIAIGSEGGGLSAELMSLCHEKVRIPMSQQCQSLNAAIAAAIIMWEAANQLSAE